MKNSIVFREEREQRLNIEKANKNVHRDGYKTLSKKEGQKSVCGGNWEGEGRINAKTDRTE